VSGEVRNAITLPASFALLISRCLTRPSAHRGSDSAIPRHKEKASDYDQSTRTHRTASDRSIWRTTDRKSANWDVTTTLAVGWSRRRSSSRAACTGRRPKVKSRQH
jgi:hypothetical protein